MIKIYDDGDYNLYMKRSDSNDCWELHENAASRLEKRTGKESFRSLRPRYYVAIEHLVSHAIQFLAGKKSKESKTLSDLKSVWRESQEMVLSAIERPAQPTS